MATGLLASGLLVHHAAFAIPTVAETLSPSTIGVGDTSTLTITIGNPDAVNYGGVALGDTYPANLIDATPSNVVTSCGGTLTGGAAGGGGVGLTGGVVTAGSSCTIVVNVTSSSAGSYANFTGNVTTTSGGTGAGANATLTVVAKPSVVASFAPATMTAGSTSTLSLAITNGNSSALSGVAFTDSLPSGVLIAAPLSVSNGCGGSVAASAGGASVTLSGGGIAAGQTCTIALSVTAASAGSYSNTAGGVASAQYSATGPAGNAAVLNVLRPPTIAESFSPNPVAASTATTLTVTLTNPNATALTGVSFSDTYPTNVATTLLATANNTCGGTATAGAGSLALSGASLAANASCTVSISVYSSIVGSYTNVAGPVSSTNGGTGTTASSTLIVESNPAIAMSFSPTRVAVGVSSTLTLTLSNTSIFQQTGVAFTDALPSGLVVAATPALSNTCTGVIAGATANSSTLSLSSGVIAAAPVLSSSSCVISIAVQSATAGNYANTTGTLSSTQSGTASVSNTATLQVVKPAVIVKAFSPSTVLVGGTSTLSLVINNANGIGLTGVAFSDAFPANLVVSATPTVTNTCGGTLTGTTAGSSYLALSGGTIPAGPASSCTITLQVTSTTLGAYSNTAGGVSANETSAGAVSNTAILVIGAPDLRVSKTHSGAFVVGTSGSYTVMVDNVAGTFVTSGTITLVDTLPTGLTYTATGSGGTGWTCGSSGQIVTCTSTTAIAAGAIGSPVTINVAIAAVAVPSVTNNVTVGGGGEPAVNANNNLAADYTLVNTASQSLFLTDGRQTSTAGTSVFYPHIFVAGYAGTVAFTSTDTASPAISGWSSSLYVDANCNGILDGSDGSTPISGSVAVAAGGQICVIARVFIPATASYNAQDQTAVTAAFTPSSTGSAASLTRTDLTVAGSVGGAGLALNKTVRNVTTNETATANDAATSGQTLEYTISYANNAASSLSVIVINDTTPSFTRFVSAQCATPLPASLSACAVTTQPMVNAQGALVWTLTGNLQSSAVGSVLFRVSVQ